MNLLNERKAVDHFPVDTDWAELLSGHFNTTEFQQLLLFLSEQRESETIFPAAEDVFNAFRFSTFADTRVVILGQDPYHGPGQAHGLSFSVQSDIKLPPSLKNIFKELKSDLGHQNVTGNLTSWAHQGVLLLNTVLTVRSGQANSHRKQGWEAFTDLVIRLLGQRKKPLVFILWGKPAATKKHLIDDWHCVIQSPHPSPLSAYRGFFGSRPFSKTNHFLKQTGNQTIDWQF